MEIFIIILVILVLLVFYGIGVYNKLVKRRNFVDTQWAQVDVQLKRRNDLIPNMVNTVKGYATHEKETLDAVISARTNFSNANSIDEKIDASNELSGALSRLMVVAEAYPDLKANTNFLELQKELSNTEDKIAYARQFYNDSVLTYNNVVNLFPSNIIAGMFNFSVKKQFEATENEKVVPNVQF